MITIQTFPTVLAIPPQYWAWFCGGENVGDFLVLHGLNSQGLSPATALTASAYLNQLTIHREPMAALKNAEPDVLKTHNAMANASTQQK